MCGKAPGVIRFEEHVGTHVKDRLSMRISINGAQMGEDLYLCSETVDFMIAHLTKMRKEFKKDCAR